MDASPRGISLGGLSKTVGLPGLRIGWLAASDRDFMARVAQLKDYTTICPAAPSEVLALIALRAREKLLGRSRSIVMQGATSAPSRARPPERALPSAADARTRDATATG